MPAVKVKKTNQLILLSVVSSVLVKKLAYYQTYVSVSFMKNQHKYVSVKKLLP